MHERLRPVRILLLVDRAVRAPEPPGRGRHDRVFHDGLVHPVDLLLRALADVDVPVAADRALNGKQPVKDELIFPVVIQSPLARGPAHRHLHQCPFAPLVHLLPRDRRHERVVLRRVQDRLPHILAVVQHRPALHALFVIPVHHQRLFRQVHRVVRPVPCQQPAAAAELPRQLRIRRQQRLVVLQLQIKHVLRLLDIRHARLPDQIQHIHRPDRDIAQPAQLLLVPVHAPYARALLHLLPARVGVDLLKVVLLQNAWDDRREHLRLHPVVRLPRTDIRPRIGRDRVRVLAHDHVEQPPGRRPVVIQIALVRKLPPLPQLPPVLVGDDAPLEILPALLVAAQDLRRPPELLLPDHGDACCPYLHCFLLISVGRADPTRSPPSARPGSAAPAATCRNTATRRTHGPPAPCPDPPAASANTASAAPSG